MAQYQPVFKPIGLGKLAPAGAGEGNAIRATSVLDAVASAPNKAYGNPQQQDDLQVNKLEFKANVDNTGRVFICWSSLATPAFGSATTGIHATAGLIDGMVIRPLDPGEAWSIGDSQKANIYWTGQFWIFIESAGDYCWGNADVL